MNFSDSLLVIFQILIMGIAWVWTRFVLPKISPKTIKNAAETLNFLSTYADKFVVWAEYFMKSSSGSEKMAYALDQLKTIAENNKIKASNQELTAILQTSFEEMKYDQVDLDTKKIALEAAQNELEEEEEDECLRDPEEGEIVVAKKATAEQFNTYLSNSIKIQQAIGKILPALSDVVNDGSTEQNNPRIVKIAVESAIQNTVRYIFSIDTDDIVLKDCINDIVMDIVKVISKEANGDVSAIQDSFVNLTDCINNLNSNEE